MPIEFQREYLLRLPLPLAQLYSRAHNAKDARGRHDSTFYLFEALIKLSTAPLVAAYLHEVENGAPRVEALDHVLAPLALPSFGQWLAMLRELAHHFGHRPDAAAHPLGHLWKQLTRPHGDSPALLALYRRIKNGPDGEPVSSSSCAVLQVFDALVQYRNGVFGHGAGRFPAFYEREMGPLLFPVANELLAEGVLDFLGPRGSRLVQLTELRTLDDGRIEVGLRELVGLQGERLAPLLLSAEQTTTLLPNRVALLWPGRSVPLRLDPLLLHRDSELAEEVLFLNRDRHGRQVEYLSYTTGRTERDRATAPALAALLSHISNRTVSAEQLQEFGERSLAETQSVEPLFDTPAALAQQVGDYEIVRVLGRGGMGVVYLARQLSLGRLVALKMLPADLAGDEVAVARLRREIRALAKCEHPHIVKLLASGTLPDGRLYYAMEYVPGCDLELVWRELSSSPRQQDASHLGSSTWARAVRTASRKQSEQTMTPPASATGAAVEPVEALPVPLPLELTEAAEDPGGYPRRVAQLMRDAALALQAVHEQHLVHRDIKPGNLMLTADGQRVVLMDFGLAKGQSLTTAGTRAGGLLGTLRYAAPEQLAVASLQVGPAADVRGLGVTLWELLTRQRLFGDAADERQLAQRIYEQDVPRLRTVDPSLDQDLEAIVARATERRAAERIQTASQLAEYLQLYLDGQPLPIRPPSTREMVRHWLREHRPLVGSVAVAVVAVVLSVVVAFVLIAASRDDALLAESKAQQLADEKGRLAREKGDLAEKEKQSREAAQLAAKNEEKQRQQVEWQLYLSQIAAAQRELQDGDIEQALARLEVCPWNLRGWEHRHLWARCQQRMRHFRGHTEAVTSVAFSTDGKRIVSGSQDRTVMVWDVTSGRETLTLKGHNGPVQSVAFSPDGTHLVSGGGEFEKPGEVMVWDATSGQEILFLKGHGKSVSSVAFSPDGQRIVSGGFDGMVKIWQADAGKEILSFQATPYEVRSVAFSPDGKRLVCGRKVWDATTGQELLSLKGSELQSNCVAFSPDGKWIVGDPGRVWDATSGEEILTLTGHTHRVVSLAFSPDSQRIVSGSWDGTVKVWDARSGQQLFSFKEGRGRANITSVAFSPDGKHLVSGSEDHLVTVWEASTSQEALSFKDDEGCGVAFSPDGKRLVGAGRGNTVKVWDANSGREILSLQGHGKSVNCVAFSPDGQRIASGSGDKTVKVWDATTGREMLSLQGHSGAVYSVAFSPDSQHIASGSAGGEALDQKPGEVKVWEVSSGREILSIKGHNLGVGSVAFSPDGQRLIGGGMDQTVKVWDAHNGRETLSLTISNKIPKVIVAFMMHRPAFSPDGQRIICGAMDGTVKVWDAHSGQELLLLRGHSEAITTVAFSQDGKRIISGSRDRTVKVWDARSGQETITLKGHTGEITSVAFSPDGKRLISAGMDQTVKVWDAGSQAGFSFRGDTGVVLGVAFSPDGLRIATGSGELDTVTGHFGGGEVKVWDARGGQEILSVKGHTGAVFAVAFSPDNLRLATGSSVWDFAKKEWIGSELKVWDARSGQEIRTFQGHPGAVSAVAFSPDGQRLLSLAMQSNDKEITRMEVKVWDLTTGKDTLSLKEGSGWIFTASFSPNGQRLLTCGPRLDAEKKQWVGSDVKLWDARTGAATLTIKTASVNCVAFSPDGQRLVGGGEEGTVKVWDVGSGQETLSLKGHAEKVVYVAFSPDGQRIVGGSRAATVKMWDARSGQEVLSLKAPCEASDKLVFSTDGRRLLTVDTEGKATVWDATAAGSAEERE